ncbi:MAG TPA: ABC transporter permease subunit [Pyrinomonadaceae bacterium]|nr:ABC transporter permease subunit [Pyrinomonadaceae bacterium]
MKTESKNLMLIYKAWLETRWRFLAGLVLLGAISLYAIFRAPEIIAAREQFDSESLPYAKYLWILLYKGYFQALWIVSAVILGLGGLWQEQATGSANFTLSLPVSRKLLVITRAAVGAAEAVILAIVPLLLIWAFSPLAGYSFPLNEAALHAVLIIGGGLVFYAWGVLLSHLMRNEFSVITLALSVCLVLYIAFNLLRVEIYNPFDLMSGKHYLDPDTFLLRGDLPWLPMGVYLAITAALIFLAAKIAERRDF